MNDYNLFRPRLIQRFGSSNSRKDVPEELKGYYNPDVDNGKLTPENRLALNQILELDYMGAAEFENGEWAKAMNKFSKTENLKRWSVNQSECHRIYFIAPEEIRQKVEDFVRQQTYTTSFVMSGKLHGVPYHLKEATYMHKLIPTAAERSNWHNVTSWFDIENLWMVSKKPSMLNAILELTGAQAENVE